MGGEGKNYSQSQHHLSEKEKMPASQNNLKEHNLQKLFEVEDSTPYVSSQKLQ